MVAIRSYQAGRFLAAPDPQLFAFLFYGTDQGLISERARSLAARLAERETPAGETIHLGEADLEDDPAKLEVELRTIPMFGGRKIVRVAAGRRVTAAVLKPLIEEGNISNALIVEAHSLGPDDSLRALFERVSRAAAVACYGDEGADLEELLREAIEAAGLRIAPQARALLMSRLGADRALSRSEIEKLILFAHGRDTITEEDVDAIIGDASEIVLERIAASAAQGSGDRALAECSAAVASGESAQTIILAVQRYFQRLHRTRTLTDAGRSIDQALRQLRPPLHFKQRDAFLAQCRAWTADRLNRALARIAGAAKVARLNPALEVALAENLLLDLVRLAREDTGRRSAPLPGGSRRL